jgi:Flp pilus assembly protein TadG
MSKKRILQEEYAGQALEERRAAEAAEAAADAVLQSEEAAETKKRKVDIANCSLSFLQLESSSVTLFFVVVAIIEKR